MKRNILEYLEYNAACYPEKTAVIDENKSYHYKDLLTLSLRIGSTIANYCEIGQPVAVLMEKSADTLAAFLGIVQAGCFYVLLNPDFPENRLNAIQSVLQARVIITDQAHKKQAETITGNQKILLMEELQEAKENLHLISDIREQVIDTDPLYAIFTSGSTGVPKGVVVAQRSVLDFIEVFSSIFSIDRTDIIGNQAPFDFDVSVKDIYVSLKSAATLVIIPKRLFSQPSALLDYICDHKISVMIWAVSALCLISTCHGLEYRVPGSIKHVLFSGEVMPCKHLQYWLNHLPDAEFVNLYGPTEITCNCTYHKIKRDFDYSGGIPIGKPFPNERVFLLRSDNTEIKEPGEIGEICVRGTTLALGYYRNPKQTETAFSNNPLNKWYPERIYHTGDLGQYAPNRELLFCGRKDFQIKHMGHRIELEEIERVLAAVPGVERGCTAYDKTKQRLYGFYSGSISQKQLYSELKKDLPTYMIPGAIKKLPSLPLTRNGKIDRAQLLERNR